MRRTEENSPVNFFILVSLLLIEVRENFQERDGREVEIIKLQIFRIQNMLLPGHQEKRNTADRETSFGVWPPAGVERKPNIGYSALNTIKSNT